MLTVIAAVDQFLGDQGRGLAIVLDAKDLLLRRQASLPPNWSRRLQSSLAETEVRGGPPVWPHGSLPQSGFLWLRPLRYGYCRRVRRSFDPTGLVMRQPQSIRFHLAAVFLLFFALVVILGAFSIWRLSNFDVLSADVAEVWLPTTRALGDLNNYTSDFRAFEGSESVVVGPGRGRRQREANGGPRPHHCRFRARVRAHSSRCARKTRSTSSSRRDWTEYRSIVNQMLVLSRGDRKAEALQIYGARRARPIMPPATRSAS